MGKSTFERNVETSGYSSTTLKPDHAVRVVAPSSLHGTVYRVINSLSGHGLRLGKGAPEASTAARGLLPQAEPEATG